MDIAEVHTRLCNKDRRNPIWEDIYFGSEPEEIPTPRENCACDNCFYGRDKLALEIIRLREIIEAKPEH